MRKSRDYKDITNQKDVFLLSIITMLSIIESIFVQVIRYQRQ